MRRCLLLWGQCFIVGILQTDAGLGTRSLISMDISGFEMYHHENHHPRQVQWLDNLHGYRRLARAGAAGDTNDTEVFPWWRVALLKVRGRRIDRWPGFHGVGSRRARQGALRSQTTAVMLLRHGRRATHGKFQPMFQTESTSDSTKAFLSAVCGSRE